MDDLFHFPNPAPAILHRPTRQRATAIRNWLYVVAALVFAMVLVGGATRLTEVGPLNCGVEARDRRDPAALGCRLAEGFRRL